jgi:NAD(P) transhydrogenase
MRNTAIVVPSIALGAAVPSAGMLSTFALSVWLGSQSVQGVAHALHSPLMSITNAISGMTIIGGMMQLGGGVVPHSLAQTAGFTAVALSSVNLSGGFIVTNKMLDMFRRPTDPPEYWNYYLVPAGAAAATYVAGSMATGNSAGFGSSLALFSGLGCIAGISSMSSQATTRLAPWLAMGGVGSGVFAALGQMSVPATVYAQLAVASGIGLFGGKQIADKVGPTELPQAVAGFHSLVGIAATSTAVGDYMMHDLSHMDGFHAGSIYMGSWMGAITCTGSIIACLKLAEKMDSKPLMLPGRDAMNIAMASTSAIGLYLFMTTQNPSTATTALSLGTLMCVRSFCSSFPHLRRDRPTSAAGLATSAPGLPQAIRDYAPSCICVGPSILCQCRSGALGFHMTASIGGADMPVVITLLNSYSGWALCAEGFILNQPVRAVPSPLRGRAYC